ncbi:hypothetical protein C0993_002465 [Termitomyces sp. T159_Od127]|nr:hypothetical protein C0993_002465 [Termitomyces sp. T159_Od127]
MATNTANPSASPIVPNASTQAVQGQPQEADASVAATALPSTATIPDARAHAIPGQPQDADTSIEAVATNPANPSASPIVPNASTQAVQDGSASPAALASDSTTSPSAVVSADPTAKAADDPIFPNACAPATQGQPQDAHAGTAAIGNHTSQASLVPTTEQANASNPAAIGRDASPQPSQGQAQDSASTSTNTPTSFTPNRAKRRLEADGNDSIQPRHKSPRIERAPSNAETSTRRAPQILVPPSSDIETFSSSPLNDAIMEYGDMSD